MFTAGKALHCLCKYQLIQEAGSAMLKQVDGYEKQATSNQDPPAQSMPFRTSKWDLPSLPSSM